MTVWYDQRADIIEAIERGAHSVHELNDPVVGPVTFDRVDYPYAEILPESSDRQTGNDWQHLVRLNCYFERDRGSDYLAQLAAAMDATAAAMTELDGLSHVRAFVPQTIEDFAGQDERGNSLVLISVQLAVGTSVDLADQP